MARHVRPGGVLVIAPFFPPEAWTPGQPHAIFVDHPDLKLVRMNVSGVDAGGTVAILDFHYLVGTPKSVEHFTEHHELGLFTDEDYRAAFAQAGLDVLHDAEGLMGRGLYIGTRPVARGRVPPLGPGSRARLSHWLTARGVTPNAAAISGYFQPCCFSSQVCRCHPPGQ